MWAGHDWGSPCGELALADRHHAPHRAQPPHAFAPLGAERRHRELSFGGGLAFSVFANRITVSELGEDHPFERVTDLGL
jgi:hypothetical protein